MYKLIDTHAHLEQLSELEPALKRAKEAGIEAIVWVGSDYQSNKQILESFQLYDKILKLYPVLGIHPGELENVDLDDFFYFLEQNINKAIAVGEIGLDYWYKQARKEGTARGTQQEVFCRQLDLANQYNRPVVIHSRGAWRDCLQFATERRLKKVLFHWYSGPEDILKDVLKAGYFISATPSCEYSTEHRRAIKAVPLENILLETDTPVRYRPKSGEYDSEPRDVVRTLEAVTDIKNVSKEDLAKVTLENAVRFFDL